VQVILAQSSRPPAILGSAIGARSPRTADRGARARFIEGNIEQARSLPGFTDEPNCFSIEEAVIDEDQWTEGYVTEP
jgi:hypothetical protein